MVKNRTNLLFSRTQTPLQWLKPGVEMVAVEIEEALAIQN